jgi:hypothetical protein
MLTTNQDAFIAQVLVLHAVSYGRIKDLLCQGLHTMNQDSPLNMDDMKIN